MGKPGKNEKIKRAEYDYHLPVLLEKSCELLVNDTNGLYVDGTLGGGGHTGEMLRRLEQGGTIHAFDKDPDSIAYCLEKFRGELSGDKQRLVIHNLAFSKACSIKEIRGKVNGLLLDLGVSSHQLDTGNRGISYRVNTVLDMRFGSTGRTAEEILHAAEEGELSDLLRKYGEEPFSGGIARRIVEKRRAFNIRTTFDLRSVVEEVVPPSKLLSSLSRVFQALRIAVNEELQELENTLKECSDNLLHGGRIVVISYHSLEDRIVKNIFRDLTKIRDAAFKNLTAKAIFPDYRELARNPRSRSAKLRAIEKR